MFKIIKSIFAIVAVASIAAGSTSAYFSDTATITGNTFSTGKLEIRVDGQQTISGQHFHNNAPGDVRSSVPVLVTDSLLSQSTLNAKKLLLSVKNVAGNPELKNATIIQVEAKKGISGSWTEIFDGQMSNLNELNILTGLGISELKPYNVINDQIIGLRYKIGVPESGSEQNSLMDKEMSWDFAIEGRTN